MERLLVLFIALTFSESVHSGAVKRLFVGKKERKLAEKKSTDPAISMGSDVAVEESDPPAENASPHGQFNPIKTQPCVRPQLPVSTQVHEMTQELLPIKKVMDCEELGIGDLRLPTQNSYLNYVQQKYSIQRTAENEYEATINMEFENPNPEIVRQMQDKVRRCFNLVNENGKDGMGRKLRLKMITPGEALSMSSSERPQAVKIRINSGNVGINAENYRLDMNCATILHESMHLMGIHDEYTPGQNYSSFHYHNGTENLSQHCRAEPQVESVMNLHTRALRGRVPSHLHCRCNKPGCDVIRNSSEAVRNKVLSLTEGYSMLPNFRDYCRVIGSPKHSYFGVNDPEIMNQQKITNFQKSGKQFSFTDNSLYFMRPNEVVSNQIRSSTVSYSCECDFESRSCQDLISKIREIQRLNVNEPEARLCPPPAQMRSLNINLGPVYLKESIRGFNPETDVIMSYVSEVPLPLYRNAYIEKIIYPNCEQKAEKYVKCSSFNYTPVGSSCAARPEMCSTSEYLDDLEPRSPGAH